MNNPNSFNIVTNSLGLGQLNDVLEQFIPGVFDYLEVTDFFATEEDDGLRYSLTLALEQTLQFSIPGLSAISLGIVRDSEDSWPIMLCEFSSSNAALALKHFPLRMVINNPLLVPVALLEPQADGESEVLQGFAFEVEGSFSIDAELNIKAELDHFSLPPFTIVGTGLVLGLQECRLITHADDVDSDITDLGFDQAFRGIHALSAQIYWDIPLKLKNIDLPGLRLDLQNLALGNQGLSTNASIHWLVVSDGLELDTEQSEMAGSLFSSHWQFALQQVDVVIAANIPIGTAVSGVMKLPFIQGLLALELGFNYAQENTYHYNIKLSSFNADNVDNGPQSPLRIPLGDDTQVLELTNLSLQGEFSSNGDFTVQGQVGLNLSLDGLVVQADTVAIKFAHDELQDSLLLSLSNIQIDGLGQIDEAQLVIVFMDTPSGDSELVLFELLVTAQWQDISQRINLGAITGLIPMPPEDGEVSLAVNWDGQHIAFNLSAELQDVHQLWPFIPEALRPEIDDAKIEIALARRTSSDENSSENGSEFDGELSFAFNLRVSQLLESQGLNALGLQDMIELESGDVDGWIGLSLVAQLHSSGEEQQAQLSASIDNPLTLRLQLPGLVLPQAPIEISITTIAFVLLQGQGNENEDESESEDESISSQAPSGKFSVAGNFHLLPILPEQLSGFVPPQIAQLLDQLLAIAKQVELSGEAELTIGFAPNNMWFSCDCRFEQAEIQIDLFDMLASALSGGQGVFGGDSNASEIDLDIDVSVALQQISFAIGSEQSQENQGPEAGLPVSFKVVAELGFAGQFTELEFNLSEQSLSFGFNELTIPIAIPKLPIQLSHLDQLKDLSGAWDYQNKWLQEIEPDLNQQIEANHVALAAEKISLQDLEQSGADSVEIFTQKFRVIPAIEAELLQLSARKFLFEAILAVHQVLEVFGASGSQLTYQQGIEIYQGAVDVALGWLHVDTQLQFKIIDAKFVLPFNNPSDVRVEGGASIAGFAPDDPLRGLGDIQFRLGISADAIYFAVEGGVEPLPLPDFGRYPGSAINFDRLIIGYGYSKNSLKIDFAGELILSPQLIEDADSSEELGVGIRLPRNNKLQFKLDLIPIVLGEVDFLLPLIGFDIDLRSDVPPPPAPSSQACAPTWDGLQLIVGDVLRADFKRFKLSPFLGPILSTNITTSFDFALGNQDYGISHICENYFTILPMSGAPTIPMLTDASPYFDRYCTSLRLGGFALSFELSRPFPQPSPLLIFELMGFISDPTLAIDPNGHIANLMYAELHHGRLSLPSAVVQMFPSVGSVANTDFSGRLNIGTITALAQQIQATLNHLIDSAEHSAEQGSDWLQSLPNELPELDLAAILQLLPAKLRQVNLQGRFVHFDASATFMLVQAKDLASQQAGTPPTLPSPYVAVYHNNFSQSDLTDWQAQNFGMKLGQGVWQVENKALVQLNNVGDNSPARYGTMLIYQAQKFHNFKLEVSAKSADNDGLGAVFHFQGKDTFYRFRMTQEQQQWDLVKVKNGRHTRLFSTKSAFTSNIAYAIRIECMSQTQPIVGLGLNRSLSKINSRTKLDSASLLSKLNTVGQSKSQTHIKIWVNDQLWCDVSDQDAPLVSGYLGLDSWWNKGLQFDDFTIYTKAQAQLTVGQPLATEGLQALSATLSPQAESVRDSLQEFSLEDISEAMNGCSDYAVVVKAHVSLFEQQVFDMLGYMDSHGYFKLLSKVNIEPLVLKVFGVALALPLQVAGRLSLSGRAAGAESYANVSASINADWQIIPDFLSPNSPERALARLLIGSEEEPANLSMSSKLAFTLKGQAELRLFAAQILIFGRVDISQSHVFFDGSLDFETTIQALSALPLFALHLNCSGRIGPDSNLDLQGSGQIHLLGQPFSAISASLHQQQLSLHAALGNPDGSGNQTWQIGALTLEDVSMDLNGDIHFSADSPAVALQGKGALSIAGASITGQCQIAADSQNWCISAQGALIWQGRRWIEGAISLCDDAISISGNCDFTLALTPQQLPANIEIAGLQLNANIGGSFVLNGQGNLRSWKLSVNWELALKLPGMQNGQSLPIATQQINVQGSNDDDNSLLELASLIAIDGLKLFDLGTITLPIPSIDFENTTGVYLHTSLQLDVDGDGNNFSYLTPVPPNANADPVFSVVFFNVYEDSIDVDVPEVTVPIPVLSTEPQNSNDAPIFSVPTIEPNELEVDLLPITLDQLKLNLKLAFKDGKLGLLIKESQEFIAFDSVLLQQIGVIGVGVFQGDTD